MTKIVPFKAIRACRDKAHLVATRSYLTYSASTLKEKLNNNPFTFLHVINPNNNDKDNNLSVTIVAFNSLGKLLIINSKSIKNPYCILFLICLLISC